MIHRRHFIAAAATVTLAASAVQAQVGAPVETAPPAEPEKSPEQMMRWMAFEGATIITLRDDALNAVLIRELIGAIDLGYFTHTERSFPRAGGFETVHAYRITPRGRAVGHGLNMDPADGERFLTTVGRELATTQPGRTTDLERAAEGLLRPIPATDTEYIWTLTPYGQMLRQAGEF